MHIRPSTPADLPRLMAIYNKARDFMAANGNPGQWINGYPQQTQIAQDIAQGHSYVCEADGQIHGVFYFAIEADPSYASIEGQWLNDLPYGVIHRIAVDSPQRGLSLMCLDWCFQQIPNLRVDTHRDNGPMQKVLHKNGFMACGVIRLASSGDERLAFQKTAP